MQWLAETHPQLVEKYVAMYYGTNSYAPKEYRKWLAEKIKPLIRKHGLQRGFEDTATGGVKSTALRPSFARPTFGQPGAVRESVLGGLRDENGERVRRSLIAEELPPAAALQAMSGPTLF